jgi:hypothetical protein
MSREFVTAVLDLFRGGGFRSRLASLSAENAKLSDQLRAAEAARGNAVGEYEKIAARWDAIRQREEAEAARWDAIRQREEAEAARWDAIRQREEAEAARWNATRQREVADRHAVRQREQAYAALWEVERKRKQAELSALAAVRRLRQVITRRYLRGRNGDSTRPPLSDRIVLILHTTWRSKEEMAALDPARIIDEVAAVLEDPAFAHEPLQTQKAVMSHAYGLLSQCWTESARRLRPGVERALERYLQQPISDIDFALITYDLLYFLYWRWSASIDDQDGLARVVRSFAAALAPKTHRANEAAPVQNRPPIKIGYLAQFMAPEPGNTIVPMSRKFLMSLARQPFRYKPILYAWMSHDEKTIAELDARGVWTRVIAGDSLAERLASTEEWLRRDQPDLLVTDMNTALPTAIFERRLAPIQVLYQFGLPFWPIENLDGVFRISQTNAERVAFAPEKCFEIVPPWDFEELLPSVDPALVVAERAQFAKGRLIGTYGRLSKITPAFLSSVADAIRDIPDVTVLLGGSGDDAAIHRVLGNIGMEDRFVVINRYVDGHLWGEFLDIFLDTFPQQGFTSCREMIAKGKPVVCNCSDETSNFAQERVPELAARTPEEYTNLLGRLLRDPAFYASACAKTGRLARSMRGRDDAYAATLSVAIDSLYERYWASGPANFRNATGSRTSG